MYPILRFAREMLAARKAPPLGPFDAHVSHHRCWPVDIDPWRELNNGRTLTLYDLGRIPMVVRMGLAEPFRRNGWGFSIAGVSVRYRKRIRVMQRFTMVSRLIGWDERFFYIEQSLWVAGECANQALMRSAIVGGGRRGLVPTAEVAAALGTGSVSPPLPDWVTAWIAADAERPWPPVLPEGTNLGAED